MYFTKKEFIEVPCQNCGKITLIQTPFVGCIYCGDCIKGDTSWGADAEEFHKHERIK